MTGPVTNAIRAMRGGHHDHGMACLLTETETRQAQAARPDSPGPLAAISILGLVSLFDAHCAAANAFTYEANTSRAENDPACERALDDLADGHFRATEGVIAELEARLPSTPYEADHRLKVLIRWHTDGEDWPAVERLLAEARKTAA